LSPAFSRFALLEKRDARLLGKSEFDINYQNQPFGGKSHCRVDNGRTDLPTNQSDITDRTLKRLKKQLGLVRISPANGWGC